MRRCGEIKSTVKQTATELQITRELTHSGWKRWAMVPVKSFLAWRWHEWMKFRSCADQRLANISPMEYGEPIELIRIEQKNSEWMRTSQCLATSIDARMWMPQSCDCIRRRSRARKMNLNEERNVDREAIDVHWEMLWLLGIGILCLQLCRLESIASQIYVFVLRLEIFASMQLWMPSEQLSYLITHTRWEKKYVWLNGNSDRSIAPFYMRATLRYRIIDVAPNQDIECLMEMAVLPRRYNNNLDTRTVEKNMWGVTHTGESIFPARFLLSSHRMASEKQTMWNEIWRLGVRCTRRWTYANPTLAINIYELKIHTSGRVDYSDVCFCLAQTISA